MKNRIIKRTVSVVVLLCILVGICIKVQWIVKPNFGIHDGRGLKFLQEEENAVDVLFLGTSNMFCTINPTVLYEETGITSYDWGSSSQSLNMTYMYLKEALKTQQPKVVCIEVLAARSDFNHNLYEKGMRWGFTYFPNNREKIEGLQVQLGGKADADFLSYIFPIIRYKDRWKELQREDFEKNTAMWLKGCHYSEVIKGTEYPDSYWDTEEWEIDETNIDSLNAIRELCEEKGIEVVLFKSPATVLWKDAYSLAVQEYAEQYGLPFIDYNTKITELGLDMANDFRDDEHVNCYGQEKITCDMGKFLLENYELTDHRTDEGQNSWDESIQMLDQYWDDYDLNQETELAAFMDKLKEEPYVVICQMNGNNTEDCKKRIAENFGVSGEIRAYVKNGLNNEIVFSVKDEIYSWHTSIGDVDFAVESSDGNYNSYFNGKKYTGVKNGVSFLIYDLKLEKIVSAANFDADNGYQKL